MENDVELPIAWIEIQKQQDGLAQAVVRRISDGHKYELSLGKVSEASLRISPVISFREFTDIAKAEKSGE